MDTPAIKRATPERKYAMRVLSFAKTVRSMASPSRKIRLFASNLEYGVSFIAIILAERQRSAAGEAGPLKRFVRSPRLSNLPAREARLAF